MEEGKGSKTFFNYQLTCAKQYMENKAKIDEIGAFRRWVRTGQERQKEEGQKDISLDSSDF